MEQHQLNDLVVGDIHDSRASSQRVLWPTRTRPVRRLNIRDLLPRMQTKEGLHQALLDGGLEMAAENLARSVPRAAIAIGYSAGGTVIWRAVARGMNVQALICVSSTRLRLEDPALMVVPTLVVTGAVDPFAPAWDWAAGSLVRHVIIGGCGHDFYTTTTGSRKISSLISDFLQSSRSRHVMS